MNKGMPILKIEKMSKKYRNKGRRQEVIREISLEIKRGEILALVGESGSGKTTIARTIMRLQRPSSGRILWKGKDIFSPLFRRLPYHKWVQTIFQNPFNSLTPHYRGYMLIGEPLLVNRLATKSELQESACRLLEVVGLPEETLNRLPYQLSGGQCQRLALARALALNPELLIADEALSSLDLIAQQELLQLLARLQRSRSISILFITHNLSLLPNFAHRIAVLHQGKIEEVTETRKFFRAPASPYSQALLNAYLTKSVNIN
ncbi:MAG: ABC transporter ATP-binding protein [Firmicutes bacterium]|nr:ABC transporter ATP-binding protein [Bacillota bacterium]